MEGYAAAGRADPARRSATGEVKPVRAVRGALGLERQRLGAAVDLGAAASVEGRDRGPGQRLVRGEQPAEGFLVTEPAVEQDRQRPRQPLDDLVSVEERGRDRTVTAWAGDGEQFTVAEELLYPADGQT